MPPTPTALGFHHLLLCISVFLLYVLTLAHPFYLETRRNISRHIPFDLFITISSLLSLLSFRIILILYLFFLGPEDMKLRSNQERGRRAKESQTPQTPPFPGAPPLRFRLSQSGLEPSTSDRVKTSNLVFHQSPLAVFIFIYF